MAATPAPAISFCAKQGLQLWLMWTHVLLLSPTLTPTHTHPVQGTRLRLRPGASVLDSRAPKTQLSPERPASLGSCQGSSSGWQLLGRQEQGSPGSKVCERGRLAQRMGGRAKC